jgi:6-methylsalicylate decarboxylase
MNRVGARKAVLSCTSPGACILEGQASYDLARKLNDFAAQIRDEKPDRFAFFASLPSLLDTEASLSEIKYALDDLKADGVVIFTRYGSHTYLGHPDVSPIWEELNRRKAVVFVHPTYPADTTQVNPRMPLPVIDFPHETSRTAMDMIMQGTLTKHPDVKVILSHGGGTLPYVIGRVATPLGKTPDFAAKRAFGVTHENVVDTFRRFYFDLALSASHDNLKMLLDMVPHDHILYGVS